MIKNLFIFTFLTLFASSCKKSDHPDQLARSTGVEISFKSESGADLLDPHLADGIKAEDIDIYYLKNGMKVRVYDAMMDRPENFGIEQHDNGTYFMKLFISEYLDAENISTTYIEIKGHGTDTLLAKMVKKSGVVYFTELLYNGALKWDQFKERGLAHFEITK